MKAGPCQSVAPPLGFPRALRPFSDIFHHIPTPSSFFWPPVPNISACQIPWNFYTREGSFCLRPHMPQVSSIWSRTNRIYVLSTEYSSPQTSIKQENHRLVGGRSAFAASASRQTEQPVPPPQRAWSGPRRGVVFARKAQVFLRAPSPFPRTSRLYEAPRI